MVTDASGRPMDAPGSHVIEQAILARRSSLGVVPPRGSSCTGVWWCEQAAELQIQTNYTFSSFTGVTSDDDATVRGVW